MNELSTNDFDFELPLELIAQMPMTERSASRLLCVRADSDDFQHYHFGDVYDMLHPGDLLVLNNTKVIPARLFGNKLSGGKVEVLIERILDPQHCLAHIRSSKSPKPGTQLLLENELTVTMIERHDALFHLQCDPSINLYDMLEKIGHMPLPPYIERADELSDKERYQTVFAEIKGAIAAPTAGLHFDEALLEKLKQKGVRTTQLTLHVGAGTFQPVRVDNVLEHKMHAEWIDVPQDVCDAVNETKRNGGRIIAVGTTSVRSLESAAASGELKPYQGDTDIFIYPGFKFNVIDGMITNFHLPKSTLLMLVSAFIGREKMLAAYAEAIAQEYRFFSYGDAMLILGQ